MSKEQEEEEEAVHHSFLLLYSTFLNVSPPTTTAQEKLDSLLQWARKTGLYKTHKDGCSLFDFFSNEKDTENVMNKSWTTWEESQDEEDSLSSNSSSEQIPTVTRHSLVGPLLFAGHHDNLYGCNDTRVKNTDNDNNDASKRPILIHGPQVQDDNNGDSTCIAVQADGDVNNGGDDDYGNEAEANKCFTNQHVLEKMAEIFWKEKNDHKQTKTELEGQIKELKDEIRSLKEERQTTHHQLQLEKKKTKKKELVTDETKIRHVMEMLSSVHNLVGEIAKQIAAETYEDDDEA